MLVDTVNNETGEYKKLHSLISPDNVDEWYVRYTWIQNSVDNEKYIANYFTDGADKGLNIRAQSIHLNGFWEGFNKYMTFSAASGALVWRVKVLNEVNRSVDYIEVWRDKKYIHEIYSEEDIILKTGYVWKKESKKKLYNGTSEIGFQKWNLFSIPGISKKKAIEHYREFVHRWEIKNNCLINTPYSYNLNPILLSK